GNSIRLRLLRSDVERLASAGIVSEEVRFGTGTGQALKYTIAASDGIEEVTAQFSDEQILVLLPESTAMEWTSGDGIGIDAVQDIGGGCDLTITVEKD